MHHLVSVHSLLNNVDMILKTLEFHLLSESKMNNRNIYVKEKHSLPQSTGTAQVSTGRALSCFVILEIARA